MVNEGHTRRRRAYPTTCRAARNDAFFRVLHEQVIVNEMPKMAEQEIAAGTPHRFELS